MANGDHSVGRHVTNKLRGPAPREFICLIGGTSNTFNGWYTWIGQHHHPEDMIDVGGPPPYSYNDIKYYVNFQLTGYDVNTSDTEEMRRHGWTIATYNAVRDKGWDPKNVGARPSETHDLYWANFIDSACHLFAKTGKIVAPMRAVEPRRGDIITFMVYFPSYKKREEVDWAASPHNFNHKDKLEAAPYHKGTTGAPIELPDKPGRVSTTVSEDKAEKERKEKDKKHAQEEQDKPLSEDDLNFYILMRTTDDSGLSKGIIKRPSQPDSYRDYMAVNLGKSGWVDGLLYKMVFFSTEEQLVDYISTGKIDNDDDTIHVQVNPPGRPPEKDANNRPLKSSYTWFSDWDGLPSIDRKHIRVCRFDYFGHSAPSGMLMDYGWSNAKGQVPRATFLLDADTLAGAVVGKVLTPDAYACLWGCFLGAQDSSGGTFAGRLAKLFPQGVTAAESLTSFEHILDSKASLPFPVSGNWKSFLHVAATGAGH